MTSTWRVGYHVGPEPVSEQINATAVETDPDNNLVLSDDNGVTAIFKREAWQSIVREEPKVVTVVAVPVVLGVVYAPSPLANRHGQING